MRRVVVGTRMECLGRGLAVALGLVLLPLSAPAADGLRIELDRHELTIDQRLRLTLAVEVPSGARVVWPELEGLGGFAVVGSETTGEGGLLIRRWWLEPERLGELTIPPLAVGIEADGWRQEPQSEPLAVRVVSVVPDGADITLHRDIAEPVDLAAPGPAVWPWLVGTLVLGIGLVAAQRLRPDGDATAASPSPHARAAADIARLEAMIADPERLDEACIELAAVLRAYLEGHFALPARRRTSEEILALLPPKQREPLAPVLRLCDRVKFARRPAQRAEVRDALAALRRLVETADDGERVAA